MRPRIIFVTGTDTGVGKTLFTGLLLHHLRARGTHALAMKPFCSGGRADVRFLRSLQDNEITAEEINPFFYPEPVAPLVSARKHRRKVSIVQVLSAIRTLAARCECLLVEGAGGLLVPLGQGYTVAHVIQECEADDTVVVAANRLGTINHTCLTVSYLRQMPRVAQTIQVVLMQHRRRDFSVDTNQKILRQVLAPVPIRSIPYLGRNSSRRPLIRNPGNKVKKTLAAVVGGR